ncbi:MAG: SurA N-terminal domain-containing protein, partial [Ignavibacteriae bacterium]|nr:SurA N-terminal domain-containing protein [Ignavibacteriota bacterium]
MDKPKIYHSTGIMNKLRDKMPYIIIFLILAFVATIVFEWGMNYLGIQGGGQQVFANINGKEITYQQYEQLLQQNLEQMRQQNGGKDIDEATMDQIREQVWQSLVQQTLTSQEIERLGIKVSDAEILDWIYNRPENLPDAIKKNFMDSTGVFNVDFYQQALGMKTKEAVNFWNEVEKYLREVLLAEKLQTQITATINVTEGDILQKYRDDNIKANFQFAFLDLNSSIDTNLIAVTDADMKKYYEEHKDEFKQLEAVKFKYVTFSDAPTIDDSNSVKKGLEFVIRDMKEANVEDSSLIRLVNDNSSVPFNNAFQKSSAFGKGALNFLFSAKNGDISPLIIDADAYKVIKLLDTKEGEDNYVNASHILINFGADTAGAKKRAEDILARAKKGEDFIKLAGELSEDPSAKQNSGDLGWFTKGSMVKEFEDACMNASPGSVVGVIKTQFGFHIIFVKGKSKKEFRVAEVRKTV